MKLKKIYLLSMPALLLAIWMPFAGAVDSITPERAATVYRENCAVCHGERGDGQSRARFGLNPPPRDFTSAQAALQLTREVMISRVTHGKPSTAMVAWQERLSAAEINGVVDYIRATFMTVAPRLPDEEPQAAAPAVAAPHGAMASAMPLGQKIYEENCRVCHGDRGNGATWTNTVLDPSPRNFTAPQSRRILTRKRMLASVTYGRKNTAMMSFESRLSAHEIESVVDYIRGTFMKGPVISDAGAVNLAAASGHNGAGHAGGGHGAAMGGMAGAAMAPRGLGQSAAADVATIDMSAAFPGGLKGNFIKGRKFYLENCSTCHGARGDGLGPRAYFIEPKPRNFLHPESRQQLNRPALFRAIFLGKPGTVMPAWGKVLTPQELANVAEYLFQDFIHPNPDAIKPQTEDEPELSDLTDKKKAN